MSGQLFAANVRLAIVNAQGQLPAGGAFFGPVNCPKLAINTPAPENPQQISRQIGTVGQIKSQAFIPKPTDISMDFDDLSEQRILGFAFNGTVGSVSQAASVIGVQAGGNVTDEPVTIATLGTPVALTKRQVSAVVVKNTAGSTTYVAGTDYTVDAAAGTVTALASGGITAGQSLKVSYTAAALTGQAITAGALGDGVYIGARQVTGFALTNSSGSTTYTLGVDYTFDSASGFVVPLKGGAIAASAALSWTGTVPALTGIKVAGATVSTQFVRVEADMQSLVDGTRWRLLIPVYQCKAGGALDLMGKNMLVASLSGNPLVPPDGSEPFSLTQYASP